MKHFVLRGVVIAILVLAVNSIATSQARQNTQRDSDPQNQNQTDTAFLTKAMEGNAAEIEFAKIAQTKSQNPQVKEFADMIVKDHTEAQDRIRDLMNANAGAANRMDKNPSGQAMLSKEHQQTATRLSKLSGVDFDREFMNVMVQDHRQDIRFFEQEAGMTDNTSADDTTREKPAGGSSTNPTSVQSLARDLLPTLRQHLTQAEQIQRTLQL